MKSNLNVELERLQEAHFPNLLALAQLPDFVKNRVGGQSPRERLEQLMENHEQQTRFTYGILFNGECCGELSCRNPFQSATSGLTSYALLPEVRGQGVATKAVGLLVDRIKTVLDQDSSFEGDAGLSAHVYAFNIASLKVLQRSGFTEASSLPGQPENSRRYELIIRKKLFEPGTFVDL